MKMKFQLLAAAALAVASAGGAFAQNAGREPSGPPLYRVEVIVFAHNDLDPTEELFTHRLPDEDPLPPLVEPRPPPVIEELLEPVLDSEDEELLRALPLPESPPEPEAEPEPARALEDELASTIDEEETVQDPAAELEDLGGLRFRLLRRDELQLLPQYRTLDRLGAYRPLLHGGWIQEGLPERDARPFDLALLGVANPRGTIRVHLSRFLHVRLDLRYQDPARGYAVPGTAELREIELAPRYELTAERQARSAELHYFDHPAFGVLLMITPVPQERPAPSEGEMRVPAA